MKNLTIVGSGNAALVAALILNTKFPNLKIKIISSKNIGIIGVGESTNEHWGEFVNFANLNIKEMIKETDATFKYGLVFENWTKHKFFHNTIDLIKNCKWGQYQAGWGYIVLHNFLPVQYTASQTFDFCISRESLPRQIQFNSIKMNKYLTKICKQKKITFIEDEIKKVNVKKDKITSIKGKTKIYKSDFFIDATGYKKVLISALGAKWNSYRDCLKLNEAIAFETGDTKKYPPCTISTAMDNGWMWRIPTQGRWGNGYVFDNTYINADEAKKECEKVLGVKIKVNRNIKFDPGSLDKPWIGNCLAVGLSASFVEPIESSSIGSTVSQVFLAMHYMTHCNQEDIDFYNDKYQKIMENIRDFVVLHYLVDKKTSRFWKELKNRITIPETLSINLRKWKNRIPIQEDFPGGYLLFNVSNFTLLLKELGLFDREKIKKEFENCLSREEQVNVSKTIAENYKFWKSDLTKMDHKQFLKMIDKF
jgi:hypothetical protein